MLVFAAALLLVLAGCDGGTSLQGDGGGDAEGTHPDVLEDIASEDAEESAEAGDVADADAADLGGDGAVTEGGDADEADTEPVCGNGDVEPPEECEGASVLECVTACDSTGTRTCAGCAWSDECHPPVEVACNGLDDDCDGSTDEGLWCSVPVPVVDPPIEDLWGIWGTAVDDVWVVGRWGVALQWDGDTWALEGLGTASHLYAIYGTSSDQAWAVGQGVFRWDGVTWSRMPSPPGSAELQGVWASSADDIWVVGGGVFRWNGTSWTVETVPGWEDMRGIWGFGADDIWAVGFDPPIGSPASILAHWDGTTWSRSRTPSGLVAVPAEDVWGISSHDVWAGCRIGYLARWDGTGWSDGLYSPFAAGTSYYGLWGFSSDDVWAVGAPSSPDSANAAHWDGVAWWPVEHLGADGVALRDVWGASPADIWIVGDGGTVLRRRE